MIDALAVLDPRNDLVTWSQVIVPQPPRQPLWSCAARLATGSSSDSQVFELVGAVSISRTDATVRAAGEAVERHAVRTPGAVSPLLLSELGLQPQHADGLPDLDWTGWLDPAALDTTGYSALDLLTGTSVEVPAGLIDDTLGASGDLGPSGAAAGPTLDFAVRAGLYEHVERDAALCAWACQLPLRAVATEQVAQALSPRARARFQELLAVAAVNGLTVGVGLLDTCLRDQPVVVSVLLEADAVASFGMKLADDVSSAAVGSLQEAFQLRAALAERTPGPSPVLPVVTDEQRADFLVSEAGRAAMQAWYDSWECDGSRLPAARGPVPLAHVVSSIAADGARPLVVDLTARLPPHVRAMGWRAVKAVVPGLQPLRLDETRSWTWNRSRVSSTPARLGHEPAPVRWDLPHFMV